MPRDDDDASTLSVEPQASRDREEDLSDMFKQIEL